MPAEYKSASKDFNAFLMDVRDPCMLQTRHQAYRTLRAVLHVFRAHLTVAEALSFASVLPPVTRAIFPDVWVPGSSSEPFPRRGELQREVKAIRRDHNLAPETAIADIARVLRRSSMDTSSLERVLRQLPKGAAEFSAVLE